MGGLSNREEL
jgi:hypothetical protein